MIGDKLTVRDGGVKDSICLPPPPTRVPEPRSPAVSHRAKLRVCVRLILSAGSLGNVTHVFAKSEKVVTDGRGLSPRQHRLLGKQLRLPSGPRVSILGCTACWDTGGLKYHLSPPSRMSCSCGVVGRRRRGGVGGGAGSRGGASLLATWSLGFSCLLICPPLFPIPLEENVNPSQKTVSRCTC